MANREVYMPGMQRWRGTSFSFKKDRFLVFCMSFGGNIDFVAVE
jgi:hypothetical protein